MQNSFLSNRFEFKYFMGPAQAVAVEEFLLKHARLISDKNSKNGSYIVNSLYYDTPQMTDYRDKDGSFLVRKKVRVRMYDPEWHDSLERVWLEVKHKRNMYIKKTRAELDGDVWQKFLKDNSIFTLLDAKDSVKASDVKDFSHFAHAHVSGNYRPVAAVRYLRRAYLAEFTSPVRITFDHDVRVCRFDDSASPHNLVHVSHNAVVMEVKFTERLPWWFSRLLVEFDLHRTDFSKYRNGYAVLRGVERIPINK